VILVIANRKGGGAWTSGNGAKTPIEAALGSTMVDKGGYNRTGKEGGPGVYHPRSIEQEKEGSRPKRRKIRLPDVKTVPSGVKKNNVAAGDRSLLGTRGTPVISQKK